MTLKEMTLNGTGLGHEMEPVERFYTATSAQAVGDIVQLDETAVDSHYRFYKTVAEGSLAEQADGLYGVVRTAAAAGEKMLVMLRGTVQANCEGATTNIAVGDGLSVVAGKAYLNKATASVAGTTLGDKVIAKAKETQTSTEAVKWVDFDGIHGFGKL